VYFNQVDFYFFFISNYVDFYHPTVKIPQSELSNNQNQENQQHQPNHQLIEETTKTQKKKKKKKKKKGIY